MNIDDQINLAIQQEIAKHQNEILLWSILIFWFFLMWLKTIIHAIISNFKEPSNKTMWIVLLVLVPPVGYLLYAFLAHNQIIEPNRPPENHMLYKPKPEDRDNWKI